MTDLQSGKPSSPWPGMTPIKTRFACPANEELTALGLILEDVERVLDAWREEKPLTDALFMLAKEMHDAYSTYSYPYRSYTFSRWREWRDKHTVDGDIQEHWVPLPKDDPSVTQSRNQEQAAK